MAFCAFDDSAALFDSTPVENMFITEYMLCAPGDFVKVYIYMLMQCYHPSVEMSETILAKELDMTEEEVERAFSYWKKRGLIRQIGDNPIRFAFYNLKQKTLTQADDITDKLYDKEFCEDIDRCLPGVKLEFKDYQEIFDWLDILKLPKEVVLMLLSYENENCRVRNKKFSIFVAKKVANEWAEKDIRTVEAAEKITLLNTKQENELRDLLGTLGQRREASDYERKTYKKWVEEWNFTLEGIKKAGEETIKGTKPTFAYLDGLLQRQHQLGREGVKELESGIQTENDARKFAKQLYAELGITGITPPPDDMETIQTWHEQGANDELILMAAKAAHNKSSHSDMDDVDAYLQDWRRRGLTTPEAVRAESARTRMINGQLREIYAAAGMEKRPNAPDRDLLGRWAGEMGMTQELILLAAEYARGAGSPMMLISRILRDWSRAGISTVEAARQEHESHLRDAGRPAQSAAAPSTPNTFIKHNYTQDDYKRMVVDLDDEEDS